MKIDGANQVRQLLRALIDGIPRCRAAIIVADVAHASIAFVVIASLALEDSFSTL